jgi:hypothetical protein
VWFATSDFSGNENVRLVVIETNGLSRDWPVVIRSLSKRVHQQYLSEFKMAISM